jgi:NADP-dependent 3-hydroxy acid dehydrogenase YdfG
MTPEGDTMTTPLKDKVALVTGASSGIGAATAHRLAAEGAAVALVARRGDKLEELARTIRGDSGAALVLQADVTSAHEASAAVERAAAELGRLDILVNNAGVMLLGPALDAPIGEWEQMVDVNVRGVLNITHAALPYLARRRGSAPARGGPRHHQLHRRAGRPPREQRLQPHEVRRDGVLGSASPGTDH